MRSPKRWFNVPANAKLTLDITTTGNPFVETNYDPPGEDRDTTWIGPIKKTVTLPKGFTLILVNIAFRSKGSVALIATLQIDDQSPPKTYECLVESSVETQDLISLAVTCI